MKRIILLVLVLVTVGFVATAQKKEKKEKQPKQRAMERIADKKAKDILLGVTNKYKAMNAMKAEFSFTMENQQEKINESYTGTLFVKPKGNKYKIDLKNQEIISDGKNKWTYLKDAKEVQVSLVEIGEEVNPAQIFTIYEKGYSYVFIEEKSIKGKLYQVIELTPVNKDKDIFKARLMVDKAQKQLVEIKLFAKNGNRFNYSVKALTPNPPVSDAFFTFDKKSHPGVEVIDLR